MPWKKIFKKRKVQLEFHNDFRGKIWFDADVNGVIFSSEEQFDIFQAFKRQGIQHKRYIFDGIIKEKWVCVGCLLLIL